MSKNFPSRTMRLIVLSIFAMCFPAVAFAQTTLGTTINFAIDAVRAIVVTLFGVAVLVFFWGIVKFISHAGDEKAAEEGKQFIVWGLVGLFVFVALWGIVGFIQSSLFGVPDPIGPLPLPPTTIPGG